MTQDHIVSRRTLIMAGTTAIPFCSISSSPLKGQTLPGDLGGRILELERRAISEGVAPVTLGGAVRLKRFPDKIFTATECRD